MYLGIAQTLCLADKDSGNFQVSVSQKDGAVALGIAEYTVREYVATIRRDFGLGSLRRAVI